MLVNYSEAWGYMPGSSLEVKGNGLKYNKDICSFIVYFQDRVSPGSPGCPRIHYVVRAGPKARDPFASASQMMVLSVTKPSIIHKLVNHKL